MEMLPTSEVMKSTTALNRIVRVEDLATVGLTGVGVVSTGFAGAGVGEPDVGGSGGGADAGIGAVAFWGGDCGVGSAFGSCRTVGGGTAAPAAEMSRVLIRLRYCSSVIGCSAIQSS